MQHKLYLIINDWLVYVFAIFFIVLECILYTYFKFDFKSTLSVAVVSCN